MMWLLLSSLVLVGCGKPAPVAAPVAPTPTAPAVETGNVATGNVAPTQNPNVASSKQAVLETSVVKWLAKKVGGQHFGTVKLQNGQLDYDANNKVVWGSFTIDMNSITVDDIQWEMQAGLLKHIQSEDFFAVEINPTATFVITSVKEISPTSLEVTGDLTIKWIRNPTTFVATVDETGNSFSAPIVIDRTLWDIKYRSLKFFSDVADKAIEDNITFDVTLNVQ
jgi:polyisoprenoid-binding protein YceI